MKRFYSRLLNPDISLGASDYYVIMLFFDVLCLITIVGGVSSFGVSFRVGKKYVYSYCACSFKSLFCTYIHNIPNTSKTERK